MEGADFSELGNIQEFQTHSFGSIVVGEVSNEFDLQGENIHDRTHSGIIESLLTDGKRDWKQDWNRPAI